MSLHSVDEAIAAVDRAFPIDGYVDIAREALVEIARTALTHLAPEAKVLDCGAGRCAKAAVAQALGDTQRTEL